MRVVLLAGDGGVVHLVVVYGYQGFRICCYVLYLLGLRWCVWSSRCLLNVTLMLTLVLSLAPLRAFRLASLLILLWVTWLESLL